jgi:protein-S-isoprenylcysteine O-methyltransferase Ste14
MLTPMPGFMGRMLLAMVVFGFLAVRVVYHRRAGERSAVRLRRERLLTRGMTISVALPLGLWLGSPLLGFADLPLPEPFSWLGYVLGLLGVGLLAWAHDTLGREFSPWLELRAEHRLVTAGPYRWVRHPIYSAGLLLILGVGLLSANLLVLLLPAAGLGTLLALRLADEEAMLAARFGEEYRSWEARTGRLFPTTRGPLE